jgi:NTP-dependent ternary system trypsin peptidase co-occuring protein
MAALLLLEAAGLSDMLLLRVPVVDGADDVIEVEVSRAEVEDLEESGVVLATSGSGRFVAASFSLASAVDHVMPTLRTIVARLRGGVHAPDEVTMQLGLQFGGETGFYFARGTADASVAVTMTWRKPRGGPGDSADAVTE